jgi:hypothetical protein
MSRAHREATFRTLIGQLSGEQGVCELRGCIEKLTTMTTAPDSKELPAWLLRVSPAGTNLGSDACCAAAAAARLHAGNVALQAAACHLFQACAATCRTTDVLTTVCTALQAALRQHPTDAAVQLAAFQAMAAVARDGAIASMSTFIRLGAVTDVVAALHSQTHTVLVQDMACQALCPLVAGSDEARTEARKAGAASAILRLFWRRPNISEEAAHDMVYFAATDLSSDRTIAAALCSGSAVERSVALLRQVPLPVTCAALCQLLAKLCGQPGVRERAGRTGAVEAIAANLLLSDTPPDYNVLHHCYHLLEHLMKAPENVSRVAAAGLNRAELNIVVPTAEDDTSDGVAARSAASRERVLHAVRAHAAAEAAAAALLEEEEADATGAKKPSRKSKKKQQAAAAAAAGAASGNALCEDAAAAAGEQAGDAAGAAGGSATADEAAAPVRKDAAAGVSDPAAAAAAEPSASAERRRRRAATKAARRLGTTAEHRVTDAQPEAPVVAPSFAAVDTAARIDAAADASETGTVETAGGAVTESEVAQPAGVPSAEELFPWLHVSPRWTPPRPPPVQEPVPHAPLLLPPPPQEHLPQVQQLREPLPLQPPAQPAPTLHPKDAFEFAVREAVESELAATVEATVTREVAAAAVAPLRAELAPLRAELASLHTALEAADKRLSCVICLDAPRCVALMPCRHLATCGGAACAALLGAPPRCPLCRERVTDTMLLFA